MAELMDLDQLQAQLELNRSSLANSILAKLPSFEVSSSSSSFSSSQSDKTHAPNQHTIGRPRQAHLGLGAQPKQTQTIPNGKPRSAADARLWGQLTAKRKHRHGDDSLVARHNRTVDSGSENEESGRTATISSKKAKQPAQESVRKDKNARKDPFATKGIEAQKAAQSQPRIIIVNGESVDTSKLSKTQRKKLNKSLTQLPAEELTPTAAAPDSAQAASSSFSSPIAPKHQSNDITEPKLCVDSADAANSVLTPLQAQMLSKLSGSRFRTINEKLYTTDSQQAIRMIEQSPSTFDEYHRGFREQVKSWPTNPLDRIAEMLDPTMAKQAARQNSVESKGVSMKKADAISTHTGQLKARFSPGALVIDLGAGQGGLAQILVPKGVKVMCFDLVNTPDGWVRKQDIASIGGLPLPGFFDLQDPLLAKPSASEQNRAPGIVDVAVFGLSLMGTNWIQMILEARRVLRDGGELIIAEVSSRFSGFDAFVDLVQQIGFALENQDTSNTHFVIFEFIKLPASVKTVTLQRITVEDLNAKGRQLLKPCLYKRR